MMVTAIKRTMSEESSEVQQLIGNILYLVSSNFDCILYVDVIAFTSWLCAYGGCHDINLVMTLINQTITFIFDWLPFNEVEFSLTFI